LSGRCPEKRGRRLHPRATPEQRFASKRKGAPDRCPFQEKDLLAEIKKESRRPLDPDQGRWGQSDGVQASPEDAARAAQHPRIRPNKTDPRNRLQIHRGLRASA
jgi:hypothetical protein